MSLETRIAEESTEAGPEDLLDKKLFETGIMEFESKVQDLQGELVLAQGKLVEFQLLDQSDLEKQTQDKIKELEKLLAEGKDQLVTLYVNLIPTLRNEKLLLSHLKQQIIQKKLLSKEQRMTILDVIGNRS
ncbi:MAG: hypothetical protein EXS47_02575 [Candidatus Zambryskibacteria bacterium]|nr:hypothetical protein [Candidatus Zambryskibacteria bacterium]